MSDPPNVRSSGPPHNPGVRELVTEKCQSSSVPTRKEAIRGFRGWNERGYLPHRDEPGLTQFVTFRLADAFPASLSREWEGLLKIEDDRKRRAELEAYLDKGRGECYLKNPAVADLVEKAFLRFHSERYELRAWVVMPNHVHVLFEIGSVPMVKVIESWKKFTAREANIILGRSGAFWQEDYWDTFIRDAAHQMRTVRYIENNPTKAYLIEDPKEWRCTSARYRDSYGRPCW